MSQIGDQGKNRKKIEKAMCPVTKGKVVGTGTLDEIARLQDNANGITLQLADVKEQYFAVGDMNLELLAAVRKLREALMMISCRVKLSDTWEYCWCDPETTKDKMHDGQCQMLRVVLAETSKWEKP